VDRILLEVELFLADGNANFLARDGATGGFTAGLHVVVGDRHVQPVAMLERALASVPP